jgi:hypothetical protein
MADFLDDCNDKRVPPRDFIEVFCKHCRNPECVRAEWAADRFSARVATQEERFFNPLRADPRLPKYVRIFEAEFEDMLHQAMQLEIADQKGDWEIPEVPILDGGTDVGTRSQTQDVDEAIKVLAEARGRTGPELPPVLEKTASTPEPEPSEPEPSEPEPESSPEPEPSPDEPVLQHPVIQKTEDPGKTAMLLSPLMNTPFPAGGAMVDGSPPPAPEPPVDPWEPPAEKEGKKVEVGATVKLKG